MTWAWSLEEDGANRFLRSAEYVNLASGYSRKSNASRRPTRERHKISRRRSGDALLIGAVGRRVKLDALYDESTTGHQACVVAGLELVCDGVGRVVVGRRLPRSKRNASASKTVACQSDLLNAGGCYHDFSLWLQSDQPDLWDRWGLLRQWLL